MGLIGEDLMYEVADLAIEVSGLFSMIFHVFGRRKRKKEGTHI